MAITDRDAATIYPLKTVRVYHIHLECCRKTAQTSFRWQSAGWPRNRTLVDPKCGGTRFVRRSANNPPHATQQRILVLP